MYVICVTSLIVQIEYRNNSWKQVYASPRAYADIFFTKILAFFLIITSCFGLFTAGFMIRQWEHIDFYPYMYPILVYFENPGFNAGGLSSIPWLSVLWGAAVLLFGFIDIRFRPEKE